MFIHKIHKQERRNGYSSPTTTTTSQGGGIVYNGSGDADGKGMSYNFVLCYVYNQRAVCCGMK